MTFNLDIPKRYPFNIWCEPRFLDKIETRFLYD
jgi:hypothetical protein